MLKLFQLAIVISFPIAVVIALVVHITTH